MTGVFKSGVIRLNTNPMGVHYPGQVITGSLLFDLERPLNFSVLYIQFLGEATVLWTENETEMSNGVKQYKEIKYIGREEYANYTQQLAGGTGISQLPAGSQAFPFEFQIPFLVPSSFQGEQGRVSYAIIANLIHIDPSMANEELKKDIQIIAPFDLNLGNPRIKQPIDLEFEEVYGCGCFCSPDPVTIRVRVPFSGYCPGQTIPVHVEVQNESNVEITKIIFELLTKELYRSSRPVSEYLMPEKVLVTTRKGPVMGHSKRNFTCDVVVPDMIAPNLENCSIIDVGYFFRVTIKLSGCNDELQDESEICFGLVPVKESLEGEYVHPLAHSLPTGPIPVQPAEAPGTLPIPTPGFTGSSTSLQKVQYGLTQSAPYQVPPPYPGQNQPYPTENKFQTPVSMGSTPRPNFNYQIGFKAPETLSVGNMPYPSNVPGGMNPSPYPPQHLTPGAPMPAYPAGNVMPQVDNTLPTYAQAMFTPSAPPPAN